MAGLWKLQRKVRQRCCHGPTGETYRTSALVHLVRAITFGLGCLLTLATCAIGISGWIWKTPSWLVALVGGATVIVWAFCFLVATAAEPSAVWERSDLERRRAP